MEEDVKSDPALKGKSKVDEVPNFYFEDASRAFCKGLPNRVEENGARG